VRDAGLLHSGRKLAAYTSDQAHFSVERAMDLLGLGRSALRKIPAGVDATIDLEALTQAIERDRQEGWTPMAIVGMVGTTAAGAIDPLTDLADIARDVDAWFHVDAAYGGAVGLSRRYPGLTEGIERADSVTVDAHKWFFVPFVAGGILHKEPDHELAAFRMDAAYIPPTDGPGHPPTDYYQRGVAGTRRFNALKVWMAMKHMGADWYADAVDCQMDLVRAVQKAVEDLPEWEVAVPASTAIVTFRFAPSSLADAMNRGGQEADVARRQRDELQDWIAGTIQSEGRFWISSTPLPDGKGLRLNVISYLTDQATIDGILRSLPELGDRARSALL
jgi:aromatic-L-amino-acid decarboxylase